MIGPKNLRRNESDEVKANAEATAETKQMVAAKSTNTAGRFKDYRGVVCPMNFVKIKLDLASMKSGEILEVLLDDGVPAESVPASVVQQGNIVLNREKIKDHWVLLIQKV